MKIAYRPEIDGLRALAVVPVILFHAGVPHFDGGFLGVDVFFVISGYLITRILYDGHGSAGAVLVGFYERRIRRIAPALILVVAATFFLAIALVPPWRLVEISKSIVAAGTFTANFFFLRQDVYFATPSEYLPLQHLWSLAVEEQFYIVYPLLFLALTRLSNRRRAWVLAGLAVASLAYSHALATSMGSAAFFRPDTRAWEILLGALCVFVPPVPGRWRGLLALLGVGLILLAYFVLPAPLAPTLQSLPVCLGAALVILAAGGDTLAGRILGLWPIAFVGLISYSLYLWHQPLLALARIANHGALSAGQTAGVLFVCLALSLLSWQLVEKPARNPRVTPRRRVMVGSLAATVLLLCGATFASETHGLAFRYDGAARAYLLSVDPQDDSVEGRFAAVGTGVCQYNPDKGPGLEEFLRNWNCVGDATGQGILVVGDSHGGDLAAGYRLNGLNVGQMTGAGCLVVPSRMSPACRAIFDHVFSHPGQYKRLVMGLNQTRSRQLRPEEMDAFVAYWGQLKLPLVLLSNRPQFPALTDERQENRLRLGDDMNGTYTIRLEAAEANYPHTRALAAGRFEVINSAEIYCAIATEAGTCKPFLRGSGWLAMESGHLSVLGARLFVARLLASQQP